MKKEKICCTVVSRAAWLLHKTKTFEIFAQKSSCWIGGLKCITSLHRAVHHIESVRLKRQDGSIRRGEANFESFIDIDLRTSSTAGPDEN